MPDAAPCLMVFLFWINEIRVRSAHEAGQEKKGTILVVVVSVTVLVRALFDQR